MSLDGVVQAPGAREEDTGGGFAHGGWSMPYFDPEAMGSTLLPAGDAIDAVRELRARDGKALQIMGSRVHLPAAGR